MSAAWVWIPTVFLSFLMLRVTASQSQTCDEPFRATITVVSNVIYPASRSFLEPDHVFYREVLRFTDAVKRLIARERLQYISSEILMGSTSLM